MTVVPLPTTSRWAGDVREDGRAVRATAHPDEGFLTLSVWKDDTCAGTVQLAPAEIAGLVARLTECLVQLAAPEAARRHDVRADDRS
ncbi:hypothetical protein ACI797_10705 [Geodermatophilus sp. SYSU D00691]